jgi:hypothetical protein
MKIVTTLLLALAFSLSACSQGKRTVSAAPASAASVPQLAGSAPGSAPQVRHIALTHKIALQAPAAELQARFQAIHRQCVALGCEVLSVITKAEGRYQSESGQLIARVPPAAFERFFSGVQAQGKLVLHVAEAEDKTAEVIDVEARIKNLEAFKARILELLAKRTASLKEALEAEQQLATTQGELDSIRERRRQLASQTELIRVEIDLQASSPGSDASWSAPIGSSLGEAGQVLAQSLSALITFSVAALPWILAGWLLIWLPLRRAWRRRKASAATAADRAR